MNSTLPSRFKRKFFAKKKNTKYLPALIWIVFFHFAAYSQSTPDIQWWNPEKSNFPVVEGQGWRRGLANFHDRLPAKAKGTVRKQVWNLSENSAGLKIKFRTNAKDIYVRYTVSEALEMPHFPATGRSGLDLYELDQSGKWEWSGFKYRFGDTITYHFYSLPGDYEREYHLYLPIYNTVKWLEIGVPNETKLTPLPLSPGKPIVVYGTSIAQGGVASRPGMAWTAILERRLHNPLINLAFSGNGRLEQPLARLMAELDPEIYIIDCLPNMTGFPSDTIASRLIKVVDILRISKPDIPILITEHAQTAINLLNKRQDDQAARVNRAADSAFSIMMQAGYKNIYWLSSDEIGMDDKSTVEGVHPTDGGMTAYADAYEQKLRYILNRPQGNVSTTRPVSQYRDRRFYWWDERHAEELKLIKKNPPEVVFIGNSITHYWSGLPEAVIHRGDASWNKYFAPHQIQNLGYGWDRIENVLWRVYHGELDGYKAKKIMINIGTNNIGLNTDEEILTGLKLLIQQIKIRQPQADLLMIGIYPRRNLEEKVAVLNRGIMRLAADLNVGFSDPGTELLTSEGKINENMFVDGLHPNAEGYEILGRQLNNFLNK